ncbi:MAG: hypothetical protein JWP29_1718 [Rhodoferax sp.]|nr:hypothetical protein [Rhodoferax sp.]
MLRGAKKCLPQVALVWAMAVAAALGGAASAADFVYTVQPGDHPWNLAERYLNKPALSLELRRLNRIPDDRRVMPGTRLRIPQAWLKLETAQVRLLAATGEVSLQTGNDAPLRQPEAGALLQAPLVLRTGPTGSASLQFADGSLVLVRRDSEVRLLQAQTRPLGRASLVTLDLVRGGLENQVTPVGASGGRFEIQTPAAVAAVRGTVFRVQVAPAPPGAVAQGPVLRTEVLVGAVAVANTSGQVTAQADQGSVTQAGQAPMAPVPLLPGPDPTGWPERIERLPIDLPMAPVAGAAAYRTLVAPAAAAAGFAVITSDETSPAARIRARDVEDGHYRLQVRAIDANGLEGRSTEHTVVVHARPEPPLLIAPEPDAASTAERPAFRWTEADPTRRYRLQIFTVDGTQPLDEQLLDVATAQAAQDLPVGLYRWRVAAIDPAKGQGPWGDFQTFRRVLPGPGVQIAPPEDGRLALRWTAQPQTARYRLQVARENSFATPLVDVETATPQYALEGLAPGLHHVRVRAIGEDGYTGPWGGTQTFSVPEPRRNYWPALWLLIPALVLL